MTENTRRMEEYEKAFTSVSTCFENIPFPLAECCCSSNKEYFGTAQIKFQVTAKGIRRSFAVAFFSFARVKEGAKRLPSRWILIILV